MTTDYQPVTGASAWTAHDLEGDLSWQISLDTEQQNALLAALEHVNRDALPITSINATNFPLDACKPVVQKIQRSLVDGRGLALLHNFPVAAQTRENIERMYWGFCAHLGQAVTQNSDGSLIHYVTEGRLRPNQGTRGVGNPGKVGLHVDLADCVSLLCVQQAADAPRSRLASSAYLHNRLLSRDPEILKRLYEGFVWDRQGEHAPGETPTTGYKVPLFSVADGQVSCRYNRHWMTRAAARSGGLSESDTRLFDQIDELTHEHCLEFDFQPGDIQFANNYTVLHGRAPHSPAVDEESARVLMRIWFDIPGIRNWSDEAIIRYGIIRHGKLGWRPADVVTGLEGRQHPRRNTDQAPLVGA